MEVSPIKRVTALEIYQWDENPKNLVKIFDLIFGDLFGPPCRKNEEARGDPFGVFLNHIRIHLLNLMAQADIAELDKMFRIMRQVKTDYGQKQLGHSLRDGTEVIGSRLEGINELILSYLSNDNLLRPLGVLSNRRRKKWCQQLAAISRLEMATIKEMVDEKIFSSCASAQGTIRQMKNFGLIQSTLVNAEACYRVTSSAKRALIHLGALGTSKSFATQKRS